MMFGFSPFWHGCTLAYLFITRRGYAFAYHSPTVRPFCASRQCVSSHRHPQFLASVSDEDWDEGSGDVSYNPEQSQMYGYISDFLRKNKEIEDDEVSRNLSDESKIQHIQQQAQFLVAIPMDECVELGLELESVQRAILYHCPVLVHACLPMAITRMPLLYVSTNEEGDYSGANSLRAMQRLHRVVADTVQRVIYNSDENNDTGAGSAARASGSSSIISGDDGKGYVGTRTTTGQMEDEVVDPLLIPFQTLEIDGVGNQVLLTVGDPKSSGTHTLQKLVEELQFQISQQLVGWTAKLPDDPQSSSLLQGSGFRPRIPFMRLPRDWDDYLPQDFDYLTSDQGGNGISPILWGQWMEDQFGEAARMREIGIYKRRQSQTLPKDEVEDEESIFHVPDCVIPLPRGNATLSQAEKKFERYQQERMAEAQKREREIAAAGLGKSPDGVNKEDPLFTRTLDRLESLYNQEDSQEQIKSSSTTELQEAVEGRSIGKENNNRDSWIGNQDLVADPGSSTVVNPDALGDWTKERIRKIVDSRERVQTEKKLSITPKTKPPIEDNPIFAKYKDGTLVPELEKPAPPRQLPPFPSREYCIGFWRVVKSPTGFQVEEGDSSRSDNLILRVDGTTAGGPILDQETRQKASAGTWKLQQDTPDSTNLRIRLVIPPRKERILVMKGKLERVSLSSDLPLTRGTFGIPALEERFARASAEVEDLLYCSGDVTIEDAITGQNKVEVGTFSLMKLNTPSDPSQYTITIPRPVKNQD